MCIARRRSERGQCRVGEGAGEEGGGCGLGWDRRWGQKRQARGCLQRNPYSRAAATLPASRPVQGAPRPAQIGGQEASYSLFSLFPTTTTSAPLAPMSGRFVRASKYRTAPLSALISLRGAPCADARMQVTSSDARRRRHARLQFRPQSAQTR